MGVNRKLRINVSVDRASVKARLARGKAVAAAAPKSALCIAEPTVAAACADLVARSVALQESEDDVAKAELALAAARAKRNEKVVEYDAAHKVCVSQVEQHAPTPSDVISVGMELLERSSHALETPAGLEVKANHQKKQVRVQVQRAPGIDNYLVEMSEGAAEPRVWQRIPGTGAMRVVDVEPGVYAFRAASMRATEESRPTEPVVVTVY